MKKSLIALAVLAASGASFAQVSITGNLTYGFQSTYAGGINGAGNTDTSGLGAETANVLFTAKEDLGGGFAATASLKLNTAPAGGTANGDDHSLTLTTPVGGFVLGTAKGADYLGGGVAGVGAYYDGWDSKIFTARTQRDFVAYVVPVGAFKFAVQQNEAASSRTFGTGYAGDELGTGGSSQAATTFSATYAAGPLEANAQYTQWKSFQAFGNAKDAMRLSGSYDLGMAKVGAGFVVTNADNTGLPALSPKLTDYLIAAKVPMGASSFGLSFASRTVADAGSATSTTGTGYALEYGYAMSKRTGVIANYARWTQVGAAGVTNGRDASNRYQLLLSHSF